MAQSTCWTMDGGPTLATPGSPIRCVLCVRGTDTSLIRQIVNLDIFFDRGSFDPGLLMGDSPLQDALFALGNGSVFDSNGEGIFSLGERFPKQIHSFERFLDRFASTMHLH